MALSFQYGNAIERIVSIVGLASKGTVFPVTRLGRYATCRIPQESYRVYILPSLPPDPPVNLPVLVKAALVHVQFESIHPFLDGNGRLGRLLITFLLCAVEVLRDPALYLSLYLKRNRQRYYELLQEVRITGNWEAWVEFFLSGVEETANQAVKTARQIVALLNSDRAKIESLGRPAASALRVFTFL